MVHLQLMQCFRAFLHQGESSNFPSYEMLFSLNKSLLAILFDLCVWSPDRGPLDRGSPDRGPLDRGSPDRGPLDRGSPDRGPPDRGSPDRGPPESGLPDDVCDKSPLIKYDTTNNKQ